MKDCELCSLEKLTKWYYEDECFVVCECKTCGVPQVVTKQHTMNPGIPVRLDMKKQLSKVAKDFYAGASFYIDKNQNKIKDHMHWHARVRK